MKKLKLKALKLGAREILNREQLKNLLGGSDTGSGNKCSTTCFIGGVNEACEVQVIMGAPECVCPGGSVWMCH